MVYYHIKVKLKFTINIILDKIFSYNNKMPICLTKAKSFQYLQKTSRKTLFFSISNHIMIISM